MVFEPRQNEERVVGGYRGAQGMEGSVESEVGLEQGSGVASECHLGGRGLDEEPLAIETGGGGKDRAKCLYRGFTVI